MTYKLDPAAIELRPRGGSDKIMQVDIARRAQAIARRRRRRPRRRAFPVRRAASIEATLRKRALAGGTLKPGDSAEGFVYFPTGSYARARATLVDVESGESEGFLVEF